MNLLLQVASCNLGFKTLHQPLGEEKVVEEYIAIEPLPPSSSAPTSEGSNILFINNDEDEDLNLD